MLNLSEIIQIDLWSSKYFRAFGRIKFGYIQNAKE